jgi:hypothetical protein
MSLAANKQIVLYYVDAFNRGDIEELKRRRARNLGRFFPRWAVTGKSFEVVAMEWFMIKDGTIHRRWGHARQCGANASDGLAVELELIK